MMMMMMNGGLQVDNLAFFVLHLLLRTWRTVRTSGVVRRDKSENRWAGRL